MRPMSTSPSVSFSPHRIPLPALCGRNYALYINQQPVRLLSRTHAPTHEFVFIDLLGSVSYLIENVQSIIPLAITNQAAFRWSILKP